MTTDLWMLLGSVALTLALIVGSATPTLLGHPRWALGNRDDPHPGRAGATARAHRTSENMKENLVLFAILVLIVHVAGKASSLSALGAQVFLGARVVHAVLYIVGVPYVRTLAWMVGISGMLMVTAALF